MQNTTRRAILGSVGASESSRGGTSEVTGREDGGDGGERGARKGRAEGVYGG